MSRCAVITHREIMQDVSTKMCDPFN
ncbi:hypothetical protein B4U80_00597 [Leptotrombidium deliense]|uniref:Uncharacterized protein n=1 Tax=Leptotrombidium deliense TaxID=299467 RepID=A0A443RSX5_9ACAR|nr:hypothetical protein B4U80_00597 [Leptotrombidium deliense]